MEHDGAAECLVTGAMRDRSCDASGKSGVRCGSRVRRNDVGNGLGQGREPQCFQRETAPTGRDGRERIVHSAFHRDGSETPRFGSNGNIADARRWVRNPGKWVKGTHGGQAARRPLRGGRSGASLLRPSGSDPPWRHSVAAEVTHLRPAPWSGGNGRERRQGAGAPESPDSAAPSPEPRSQRRWMLAASTTTPAASTARRAPLRASPASASSGANGKNAA